MFYLCIIYTDPVDNSTKLEPLLTNVSPKLDILEKIYKNIKPILS